MRLYSVCVATLALLFATTALLLRFAFANNPTFERVTCLAGVCSTDDLMGRAYQMLLAGGPETPAAVDNFRTVLYRNPASPHLWATLAEALADTGDDAAAKDAMLRAIELGPALPQIRIRAANLFAALGDRAAAGRSLAVVLHGTPAFDQVVFDSFRRFDLSAGEVLALLLEDRRAIRAWFYDVRQHGSSKDLTLTWDWLLACGYVDEKLVASYLDALLGSRLYGQAHQDWIHYLAVSGQPGSLALNRIYNPGFESEPSGSPFDWRLDSQEGVTLVRDSKSAQSGNWSLRISFSGAADTGYQPLKQVLVISPGRYLFEAWVRTAGLPVDRGIAFRVFDVENPERFAVQTGQVTGTCDWTRVALTLNILPSTELIGISLVSPPSLKLHTEITGTAWVDSVALTPSRAN